MSRYTNSLVNYRDFDPRTGRKIPLYIQLNVLIGNPLGIIGIVFLLVSIPLFVVFGKYTDFDSMRFGKEVTLVEGTVNTIEATNASVNEEVVYRYYYTYPLPESGQWSGISFTEGYVMQEGQKANIEYLPEDPRVSRIQGMRCNMFSIWVLFIIMPFGLIGIGFGTYSVVKGRKAIFLLRFGAIAEGRFLSKEATNMTVNRRRVYAMKFEFETRDGQKYTTEARTHLTENLTDEDTEKLVYEVQNPENAQMIDELPKSVRAYFKIMIEGHAAI